MHMHGFLFRAFYRNKAEVALYWLYWLHEQQFDRMIAHYVVQHQTKIWGAGKPCKALLQPW